MGLTEETRDAMLNDACRLLAADNYRAAGTVEFLVDKNGKHYFMEVNPRVQVRRALHVIFMFCFLLTLRWNKWTYKLLWLAHELSVLLIFATGGTHHHGGDYGC